MPSFSFVLTEKCDWNCEYCHFSGLSDPKESNLDVFKKHLPYIKKIMDYLGNLVVNIDIQGGEVGLIDADILQYFFETIGSIHKIDVSTNGMFLHRGFNHWPGINENIGKIMWHVADLKGEKRINVPKHFHIKDYHAIGIEISRGIVHDNIDEIVDFVRTNSHILFDYIEFEFDIKQPRKMNVLMYHELISKLDKLSNITENAREILVRRIYENENHRDWCHKYNHSILINLANETICLCQREPNIYIPLTEENLIWRLKKFPKDLWMDLADGIGIKTACDSCTRLYAGKYAGNVVKNTLLTRNKLRRIL